MKHFSLLAMLTLGLKPDYTFAADDIAASRRTAIVKAVERVEKAVVSIHVQSKDRLVRSRDPFFYYFYGPYIQPGRTQAGSGLIVNQNGYILTNAHLFGERREQISRIEVVLFNGLSTEAKFIGSDVSFDLAVLKIETDDLPVASMGDSDDILVGEWAIAIGNPFDLGPTVTSGVVSAINRDFHEPKGEYYYRNMIQTDASINPGNSGGPLVNALGEVIGINSFIYTGSDYDISSIGVGFAIPINTARRFLEEITQYGKIRRPWSGIVYLQDLNRALADALELTSTDGVLILKVEVGSPAYDAGLERGDVITAINGDKIHNFDEARAAFREFRVDETCTLTIIQDGQAQERVLRFEEWPHSRQRWN